MSLNSKMILNTIYKKYVLDAIGLLKNGKASGPDKFIINLIKDAAKFIAYPIMCIFNSSIANGVFPYVWKAGSVTLNQKLGFRLDLNNYRPIPVIPVFARMLERLAHDQLYEFLKVNNILSSSQAAVRTLYSTTTSLVSSMDHWQENVDNLKLSPILSPNFRKAFDTVDHNILIMNLNSYRIADRVRESFVCYLKSSTQYCTLNGNKSKQKKITCGIHQGSCLGSLLYLHYLSYFKIAFNFQDINRLTDDGLKKTTIKN